MKTKPTRILRPSRIWLGVSALLAASLPAQVTTTAPSDPTKIDTTEAVQLGVFEVSGSRDEGYRSSQSVSSSKTVESLLNSPNSISIMNRELMNDLNITSMPELSMYGVTGEATPQSPSTIASYTFRGIVSTASLRNGIIWSPPVDSYNIERAEILRGPSAFLYGEGVATGVFNQLTKEALPTSFVRPTITVGSFDLYRAELDINRRLSKNLSTRLNLGYQNSDSYVHFVQRKFRGISSATTYTPASGTTLKLQAEYGRINETRPSNILADGYTTTKLNGATSAYTTTSGGYTFIPETGKIYDMVGQRVSSGLNVLISDPAVFPRDANYTGPNSYHHANYNAVNFTLNQRVTDNFNLQVAATRQEIYRYTKTVAGSLSGGVFLDTNATLPDGTVNPNVGQLYTEYTLNRAETDEFINEGRLTLVYDLKLPFMTQRVIGTGAFHDDTPVSAAAINEFNIPGSGFFKGSLINANTLAAYQANVATLNNNFFYRRFYLKDGDGAQYTQNDPIPGRTVIMPSMGGSSGRLVNRKFATPSFGGGLSGTYFKDRLHTLVGWRRDYFIQTPELMFYNPVTGQQFKLAESSQPASHITKISQTAGAVLNITNFLSASFNYANSVGLSSGIGGSGYEAGTIRGLTYGDGKEYGLRWTALDGKLESNWVYYTNNQLHGTGPVPSSLVLNELQALFTDFNTGGLDTQTSRSTGYEIETVMNLTKNWRLTWNLGTNKLATADRDPVLKSFAARAKAQGFATPNLDQFLTTIPDGTPVAGYTKTRTNLVTNYRFSEGPLKNFTVGGGFQYRQKTYVGNADLNRDGVAEQVWFPGYTIINLSVGYRATVWKHPVRVNGTVSNALNNEHLRVNALTGGAWDAPRSFRLSMSTDL